MYFSADQVRRAKQKLDEIMCSATKIGWEDHIPPKTYNRKNVARKKRMRFLKFCVADKYACRIHDITKEMAIVLGRKQNADGCIVEFGEWWNTADTIIDKFHKKMGWKNEHLQEC